MKGILGRKLGMTQIFDPETGGVTAVTVIEAGPCPVTHVRSEAADGYTAVQLAYEPVVDRKITKGELGHLKKAGTTAHRHLAEFRGDTELDRRRHRHRRGVRARRRDQGRGHVDRQGLRRHDQAAQLQARPRQPRLAQRPQARLDRRLGDAVARVPGTEDVGPHGRRPRHPARARRPRGGRRAQPAARQGLRPGPEERHRRDQEHRLMAALKAAGRSAGPPPRTSTLEAAVFGAELKKHIVHEVVRAELNAHRAGTRGAKTRGLVSGGRAKPWRQKGTGRARQGTIRAPALHGRRCRVRARDAQLRGQGEPQGPSRRARRRALEPRRQRDARARRRLGVRDARRPSRPRRSSRSGARRRRSSSSRTRTRSALIKSFRNLDRVLVTVPSELEVAPIVWARSVLVSEAALAARRREGIVNPADVLIAPVVSEKSYSGLADRKYTFKVHQDAHKTQVRQAVEQLFGVKVAERPHRSRCRRSRSGAASHRASVRAGRRPSCSCTRARRSRSSKGLRSSHGSQEVQAHEPGTPLHGRLLVRGRHQEGARRSRSSSRSRRRAAGTTTAASRRATRVAATSAGTA